MAVNAAAQWDARATATAGNVNGGFFVTGASGVDYSQQNAAQYALTGVTSAGAGNTILTASAATDMVGNGIRVVSGTNFTVGWFEITSVVAGVSITCSTNAAGASISTGVGATGVMNVGGALSMNSTFDDDIFEAGAPGNTYWFKGTGGATFITGESITIALNGTVALPIMIQGYNSTHGDTYTAANTPIISCGSNSFLLGQFWKSKGIEVTTAAANGFQQGTTNHVAYCKSTNKSTTVNRLAFGPSTGTVFIGCEGISYRGRAVETGSQTVFIDTCWFHDSDICIQNSGTGTAGHTILNTVVSSFVTAGIRFASNLTGVAKIKNCTVYGAENKNGLGITFATGLTNPHVENTIIYGCTTGVTHADTQRYGVDDYNTYFNNTNDVSAAGQWQKGANTIAVNPAFANVTQITGTTATTSGSVLTQAAFDFAAAGVVAGRDFVYLKSGTGVTVGIYGITTVGTTTLTLDIAPGTNATADKTWQITLGNNFAVGSAMQVGYPGAFPGGMTTAYTTIGAIALQGGSSGGGATGNTFGG